MMIPRRKKLTANIAFYSVGLDTYCSRFPGLLTELKNQTEVLKRKLLAHQPSPTMDDARATTFMQLCNDDFFAVPEFTGVAVRMGKPVADIIVGMLKDDPLADEALARWCRIAHARHDLRSARIGLTGGVLDTMLDPTAVTAAFGAHAVPCEPDGILLEYQALHDEEPAVKSMSERLQTCFDTPDPVSDPVTARLTGGDLALASRTAVALERFIERKQLDALACDYEAALETPMRKWVTNLTVGNTLLAAAGFPMCGEFDLKTGIAMSQMDRLEIGGSFAEFHPIGFNRDSVLIGHDGPTPSQYRGRQTGPPQSRPGRGGGIQNPDGTDHHAQHRSERRQQIQIHPGRGRVSGRSGAADRKHEYPRQAPARYPRVPARLVSGRPAPSFRALGIGYHADELSRLADSFGIGNLIVTR